MLVERVLAHLTTLRIAQVRVVKHLTSLRTAQYRVEAHHTVPAVKRTAVKPDLTTKAKTNMLAAITSNFKLRASGGGANQLRRFAFGWRALPNLCAGNIWGKSRTKR